MIRLILKAVVPGGEERLLSEGFWCWTRAVEEIAHLLFQPTESTAVTEFSREALVIEDLNRPVIRLNYEAAPENALRFVYRFECTAYQGDPAEFRKLLVVTSGFFNMGTEIASAQLRSRAKDIVWAS